MAVSEERIKEIFAYFSFYGKSKQKKRTTYLTMKRLNRDIRTQKNSSGRIFDRGRFAC
jgi:hypothetical protein